MPRANGDGMYRTTPSAATQSVAPASPKAEARAAASEGGAFSVFDERQMDVLGAIIGETQILAEKQTRAAVKALREEVEIEVGLVREEVMSRMDSRLFGSTLVDDCGEIARKAVHELRREIEARDTRIDTGLDDLRARLDRSERAIKREALEAWRGTTAQLARNFGRCKDTEGKMSALAAQLDQLGNELRRLRFDLGDEGSKPWAPLALPAPSA